jgi:hypothetical protein
VIGKQHGAWIRELAANFDIVWCSSWEQSANDVYAPALGIEPLPYIEFPRPHGGISWKLPRVREYVGERAFAWIDDELRDEERAWAEVRRWPIKLVPTTGSLGMARWHVNQLLDWAEEQEARRSDRDSILLTLWYLAVSAGIVVCTKWWDDENGRALLGGLAVTSGGLGVIGGVVLWVRRRWRFALRRAAKHASIVTGLFALVFLFAWAPDFVDSRAAGILLYPLVGGFGLAMFTGFVVGMAVARGLRKLRRGRTE